MHAGQYFARICMDGKGTEPKSKVSICQMLVSCRNREVLEYNNSLYMLIQVSNMGHILLCYLRKFSVTFTSK
jgi:hypothetical protein